MYSKRLLLIGIFCLNIPSLQAMFSALLARTAAQRALHAPKIMQKVPHVTHTPQTLPEQRQIHSEMILDKVLQCYEKKGFKLRTAPSIKYFHDKESDQGAEALVQPGINKISVYKNFFKKEKEDSEIQEFNIAHEVAHIHQFEEMVKDKSNIRQLLRWAGPDILYDSLLKLNQFIVFLPYGLFLTRIINPNIEPIFQYCITHYNNPWLITWLGLLSSLSIPGHFLRTKEYDADKRAVIALNNCKGGIKCFESDIMIHRVLSCGYILAKHPSHYARIRALKEIEKELSKSDTVDKK